MDSSTGLKNPLNCALLLTCTCQIVSGKQEFEPCWSLILFLISSLKLHKFQHTHTNHCFTWTFIYLTYLCAFTIWVYWLSCTMAASNRACTVRNMFILASTFCLSWPSTATSCSIFRDEKSMLRGMLRSPNGKNNHTHTQLTLYILTSGCRFSILLFIDFLWHWLGEFAW